MYNVYAFNNKTNKLLVASTQTSTKEVAEMVENYYKSLGYYVTTGVEA